MRIMKRLLKLLSFIIALVVGYKAVYLRNIGDLSGSFDCTGFLLIIFSIHTVYQLINKWRTRG